jgi:hypothetical protein
MGRVVDVDVVYVSSISAEESGTEAAIPSHVKLVFRDSIGRRHTQILDLPGAVVKQIAEVPERPDKDVLAAARREGAAEARAEWLAGPDMTDEEMVCWLERQQKLIGAARAQARAEMDAKLREYVGWLEYFQLSDALAKLRALGLI